MLVTQRDEFDAGPAGVASMAYPHGSNLFTLECQKERVHQRVRLLTGRTRQDLGTLAVQSAQSGGQMASQASEALTIGQSLLKVLQAADPVRRLVVDLDRVIASQPELIGDVMLRDGDHLRIPMMPRDATVFAEGQNATSRLDIPTLTCDDYSSMSGTATGRADEKRIYVVRARGSVDAGSGSRWFRSSSDIRPGDTIVVRLNTERRRPLPLWTVVTTILHYGAISVATVNSF